MAVPLSKSMNYLSKLIVQISAAGKVHVCSQKSWNTSVKSGQNIWKCSQNLKNTDFGLCSVGVLDFKHLHPYKRWSFQNLSEFSQMQSHVNCFLKKPLAPMEQFVMAGVFWLFTLWSITKAYYKTVSLFRQISTVYKSINAPVTKWSTSEDRSDKEKNVEFQTSQVIIWINDIIFFIYFFKVIALRICLRYTQKRLGSYTAQIVYL